MKKKIVVKAVCHKCRTYNPKAGGSYKCAVKGSCPGLEKHRDPVSRKHTTAVTNEIKFLKKYRGRFSSTAIYEKALLDMLREGMITRAAYNAIKSREKIKKPLKKVDERIRTAGSCGGSISWNSHC